MGDNDLLVPASALATDKAWEIVRRLAEKPMLRDIDGARWCALCDYRISDYFGGLEPAEHDEDCLWIAAREMLDAKA